MMKRMVALLLCAVLLLGLVGCGKDTGEDPATSTPVEESYPEQYVVDPVVNRFVVAFKKQTRYTLAGLAEDGNRVCSAYIDHYPVTITSTDRGLHFAISGGSTPDQQNRILDIFYSIAQVVDPSCTDAQAQAAVTFLKSRTEIETNYRVCNGVLVNSFVPITEVAAANIHVDCRMDFTALDYLPEKEEE